jgi:hypothetical protein
LNLKDVAIAIAAMIDYEKLKDNMRQLAEQLKEMQHELKLREYEDNAWMWLWRKCGGVFHGTKTVCAVGCNIYASSKSGMGRQRSRLQGKRETSMGTAEVEYEEG